MDFLQAQEFAEKNKYAVIAGSEFQSRCISGRYHSPSYLPPLSKPGADVGEILAILASLRNLNLMLSYETVLEVVLQTVGGEKNFHFHTDDGHASGVLGCTFLSLAKMHFTEFGLTMDEIEFILTALERLKRKGANMTILHGGHSEKAVFEVESEKYALKNIFSLLSAYDDLIDNNKKRIKISQKKRLYHSDIARWNNRRKGTFTRPKD